MLRSLDELRILQSIAEDTTKSLDERAQALAECEAELEIRIGFLQADAAGWFARFNRDLAGLAETMRDMGATMDRMVRIQMEGVTAEQAAAIRMRAEQGEPIMDAICAVCEPDEERTAIADPADSGP